MRLQSSKGRSCRMGFQNGISVWPHDVKALAETSYLCRFYRKRTTILKRSNDAGFFGILWMSAISRPWTLISFLYQFVEQMIHHVPGVLMQRIRNVAVCCVDGSHIQAVSQLMDYACCPHFLMAEAINSSSQMAVWLSSCVRMLRLSAIKHVIPPWRRWLADPVPFK